MYIYKTTNNINNKQYVGYKTKSVKSTLNYYGSGKYLKRAINKYSKENFTKTILYRDIKSFTKLCHLERECIRLFDTFNNGYNLTKGGEGTLGRKHTLEYKKYMSLLNTGKKLSKKTIEKNRQNKLEYYKTHDNSMKDKKHTKEARKKMSEAKKGSTPWNKGVPHTATQIKKLQIAQQRRFNKSDAPIKGRISCLDVELNISTSVHKEEYHKLKGIRYFGVRSKKYKEWKIIKGAI